MSDPDFRNGINITELSKERAKKAEYINEKMKEATNNRKSGKAHTGRVAIDGGYELLKMLEDQEEEERTAIRKIIDFKDKLLKLEL